jgi:hypothetical protein
MLFLREERQRMGPLRTRDAAVRRAKGQRGRWRCLGFDAWARLLPKLLTVAGWRCFLAGPTSGRPRLLSAAFASSAARPAPQRSLPVGACQPALRLLPMLLSRPVNSTVEGVYGLTQGCAELAGQKPG